MEKLIPKSWLEKPILRKISLITANHFFEKHSKGFFPKKKNKTIY